MPAGARSLGIRARRAVETWADILGPQYLDLALLTAFIVLALVSFRRKSVPLKFVTFAAAIGYMGFAKSYLISITNIFSVIDWNLPVVKYNLAWYLFFGFTVVSTVLWGRLYCGRVCAYGALTQTLDAVIPRAVSLRGAARRSKSAPRGSSSASCSA